ncbi:MAG: phosphatase PAP2 family protein [Patescibacteria group bacterium]
MNKILLLVIFLLTKSIYLPLNKRISKYYWKIKFDDRIPFIPVFIIPYIGYFFYVAATIIYLWNTKYINSFFVTYIISYILAGLFWYFVPNGVKRPKITSKDIFSRLTTFIYKYDDDTNGFPSAHVLASLTCSYFLTFAFPQQIIFIWSMNFLICISTIFVKQHYVLDIFGGIIFFFVSILLGSLFITI